MRRFPWILLLLLLCACDDAPAPSVDAAPATVDAALEPTDATPEPPPVQLESGPLSLTVGDDLQLRWRGEPRLRFAPNAFQVATVTALDESFNYDPWYLIERSAPPPPGLQWHVPLRWTATRDGAALHLALDYGALGRGAVRFTLADAHISAQFTPPEGPVAFLRLTPNVDATEGFYGLGEVLDTPNHRGHTRAMQLELERSIESLNNEANVPIPLLIGTTGWGLFIDDAHPIAWDVAKAADDVVDVQVGLGLDAPGGLRFHLFAADHPLDITQFYYLRTGRPELPAPWALGPWLWRDENEDQAEVESDLATMRALDLPATGLWVDRPYGSGVSAFDFEPSQFPDPEAMIARAHALGFRFALWHTAYVGEDQPGTAQWHDEAEANGYYPPESGAIVNNWGRPVDLTNPEAYAWWQALVRRYTAIGVEGFKLDYMQDIILGLGPVRNRWLFADGRTERTMHTRYQALYHQVFAETLPETGGFLLTRTGAVGDQTLGVIIWPGDLDSSLLAHGEAGVDRSSGEQYKGVGGLPAALVAGLSLGPSGFAFYGSDTGGYRHCPPDKEIFTRWFQQTALSAVMQIGTSCNDVAWSPTALNGFDAEMLDWYRRYTRLHLRLWPYAWTLAHHLQDTGRPLLRPYGLQHPELGLHPADTYFFGDALLVAPVVVRDQRSRLVPFPPGVWFDWWTGAPIEGGQARMVPAPLDTLPLYLRAGGIVPLLRPTIDTIAPTTEPAEVDSFATDAGRLYVHLALGPQATLTLFDGSEIAHGPDGSAHQIQWRPGDTFDPRVEFVVLGASADHQVELMSADGWAPAPPQPDRAALEASEEGAWWDVTTGRLHVRPGPTGQARLSP
jgi:alpha-D-xyloside xylohydrolase